MKKILCIPILLLSLSCTVSNKIEVVVDSRYTGVQGELSADMPTFTTIKNGLDFLKTIPGKIYILNIKPGRYYEKLEIVLDNIIIRGKSSESTVITFDANGETLSPEGKRYGTSGCATLIIKSRNFQIENITVENAFDYPSNAAKKDNDPTKIKSTQAVAVYTTENNDKAVFKNCVFKGYQDTFYGDAGRHYLVNCRIYGHVDFIFGAGQVVFEDCDIYSRNRVGKNPTGYITAPSTLIANPYGMLFLNCKFLKEDASVPARSVSLGRPWHPGGNPSVSGNAVFRNCFMDDHIDEKGYARISSRNKAGERIWFEVGPDSRFFEYESHGPGAIKSSNRPVLSNRSAIWYTRENVLNGWTPWEDK